MKGNKKAGKLKENFLNSSSSLVQDKGVKADKGEAKDKEVTIAKKVVEEIGFDDISEHVRKNAEFSLVIKSYLYETVRPIARKYSLKITDIMVIFLLATNKEIKTATDISKHSDMKRGNISIIIDALMNKGYIEQEEVKEDRRQKYLHLTPISQDIVADCVLAVRRMIKILIKGIPAKDIQVCDAILNKMFDNLIEYAKQIDSINNKARIIDNVMQQDDWDKEDKKEKRTVGDFDKSVVTA